MKDADKADWDSVAAFINTHGREETRQSGNEESERERSVGKQCSFAWQILCSGSQGRRAILQPLLPTWISWTCDVRPWARWPTCPRTSSAALGSPRATGMPRTRSCAYSVLWRCLFLPSSSCAQSWTVRALLAFCKPGAPMLPRRPAKFRGPKLRPAACVPRQRARVGMLGHCVVGAAAATHEDSDREAALQ